MYVCVFVSAAGSWGARSGSGSLLLLVAVLTAHVEAVLSSLQQQQAPPLSLPPEQLQALRESQGRWLARQEAAILAACQVPPTTCSGATTI